MRPLRRKSRGLSIVECAILFVLVIAAMVSMFSFIRSAVSHRMKTGVDGISQGMLHPD